MAIATAPASPTSAGVPPTAVTEAERRLFDRYLDKMVTDGDDLDATINHKLLHVATEYHARLEQQIQAAYETTGTVPELEGQMRTYLRLHSQIHRYTKLHFQRKRPMLGQAERAIDPVYTVERGHDCTDQNSGPAVYSAAMPTAQPGAHPVSEPQTSSAQATTTRASLASSSPSAVSGKAKIPQVDTHWTPLDVPRKPHSVLDDPGVSIFDADFSICSPKKPR